MKKSIISLLYNCSHYHPSVWFVRLKCPWCTPASFYLIYMCVLCFTSGEAANVSHISSPYLNCRLKGLIFMKLPFLAYIRPAEPLVIIWVVICHSLYFLLLFNTLSTKFMLSLVCWLLQVVVPIMLSLAIGLQFVAAPTIRY